MDVLKLLYFMIVAKRMSRTSILSLSGVPLLGTAEKHGKMRTATSEEMNNMAKYVPLLGKS